MIIEKKLEVNNMTSNENDFMKISASSTLSETSNVQIYNAFNEANLISPSNYPCYHSAHEGYAIITIEFKQHPVCLNRIDFQKRQGPPLFDVRDPKVYAINSNDKLVTLLDSNIVIGSTLNDKGFTEVRFDNHDYYYKYQIKLSSNDGYVVLNQIFLYGCGLLNGIVLEDGNVISTNTYDVNTNSYVRYSKEKILNDKDNKMGDLNIYKEITVDGETFKPIDKINTITKVFKVLMVKANN